MSIQELKLTIFFKNICEFHKNMVFCLSVIKNVQYKIENKYNDLWKKMSRVSTGGRGPAQKNDGRASEDKSIGCTGRSKRVKQVTGLRASG